MASWGLAYEYGKNAYEDMWRKQEENDRIAAERELFNKKLKGDILLQETANIENARISNYRIAAAKYGDAIRAGGKTGVKAFADALTFAGEPYTVIDGNKIARLGVDGKPDLSTTIDMSSWNGDQMAAEFGKYINTLRKESDEFKATKERDRAFDWEKKKFKLTEEGKNKRAAMQLSAMMAISRAKAAGSGSSGGKGSGGSTSYSTDDTLLAASDAAIKSMFGADANAYKDDDGVIKFKRDDDTPIELSPGQKEDLLNIRDKASVAAANNRGAYGISMIDLGRELGKTLGAERNKNIENTNLLLDTIENQERNYSYGLPEDPFSYSISATPTTASYYSQGVNLWNKVGTDGLSAVEPPIATNKNILGMAEAIKAKQGKGIMALLPDYSLNYN